MPRTRLTVPSLRLILFLETKMEKNVPNTGPLSEWPRLKGLRKAGDIELLKELENPEESDFHSGGKTYHLTARAQAARELGKLREVRAIPAIAELLNDPRFTIRVYAVMALGDIGDADARPLLSKALHDADASVRLRAAESLGKLNLHAAPPDLIATLSDGNGGVRVTAAKSLSRIGDRKAIHPLKEAVRQEGLHHPVRRFRLGKALFLLRLRSRS
jgi:HEAT repeats/PBS lyase HEAT-like repeat